MVVRWVLKLLLLAVVIGAVAEIVPGIEVNGGWGALLWISFLFSLVNAILGPVFKLLSLPLIVLSLGLFLLVINAALLGITAGLSSHLNVDSFGAAVLGGLLIALFSWLATLALPNRRREDLRAG
ncbi:MAG: putative rane protein [Pseudonocardiales bacterium]|jgi:putative membrane protein|nr:putative rane protein [Pseudonocardiales bacterium]